MPLTEQARDYLVAEGLKPQTVIKTGSPMLEVLNKNMEKILSSNILEKLEKGKCFLLSAIEKKMLTHLKTLQTS